MLKIGEGWYGNNPSVLLFSLLDGPAGEARPGLPSVAVLL
jgi:hypothetical protein